MRQLRRSVRRSSEIECQRVDAEIQVQMREEKQAIQDIRNTINDGTVEEEVKSSMRIGIWKLINIA